jgi:tRNA A-37 threonylcarbamoyl transferase component Bud32
MTTTRHQTFKLWNKFSEDQTSSFAKSILFLKSLGKRSSKREEVKYKQFMITKNHLCFKNNKQKFVGLDLKGAKVDYIGNMKLSQKEKSKEYQILITKKNKFAVFFVQSERALNEWKYALRRFSSVIEQREFQGNYQKIEKICSGKFCKMFKGICKKSRKTVFFKIYDKEKILETENLMEKIYREIRILIKLRKENLAPKFQGLYEINTKIFLELENLENYKSLLHFNEKGNKSENNFKESKTKIQGQILDALNKLHNLGIVHNSFKPQHIMINEAKRSVKFVDFTSSFIIKKQKKIKEKKIFFTELKNLGIPRHPLPELLALWSIDLKPKNLMNTESSLMSCEAVNEMNNKEILKFEELDIFEIDRYAVDLTIEEAFSCELAIGLDDFIGFVLFDETKRNLLDQNK